MSRKSAKDALYNDSFESSLCCTRRSCSIFRQSFAACYLALDDLSYGMASIWDRMVFVRELDRRLLQYVLLTFCV